MKNGMNHDDLTELLRKHGSRSIEYRRAWRKDYRERNPRIDYIPDRRATAALELILRNGWALSCTDAINRALADWVKS